jgi:hypothetical protein
MKVFKSIFIIALFGLILWSLRGKKDNSEYFVRKKAGLLRLITAGKELNRLWIEGEDSREWSIVKKACLKKYEITNSFDESLLGCHPMIIDCADQFLPKKNYSIIKSTYQYPTYLFTLEDTESKEKLNITLKDNCHELYLEQNIFTYGEPIPDKSSESYQFDTFNRHIYFDRHLVTNYEINEWIKFDQVNTKGIKIVKKGNRLFLPSSNLSAKEMQNYCSFKGKQVMSAPIFDAAAFLSQEKNRSPYYWTKKKKDLQIDCGLIYSKECLDTKPWELNSSGPSWAGLYDSLGGVLEFLQNPIDPESNLKASSFYFPKNSHWHRLGYRANWDGLDHNTRNFNFKGIEPINAENTFAVGFRCMREVYP